MHYTSSFYNVPDQYVLKVKRESIKKPLIFLCELFAGDEKIGNRKEKSANYLLVCINNVHALKKLHFYSFSENI
jgi:hypothetical protein